MTQPLRLLPLLQDSLARTGKLIVPSLPLAGLFVAVTAGLVWAAGDLPESGPGFALFVALTCATLYAHSLFSAAMYRAVLPRQNSLVQNAWKLTLAWLLVIVIAAIAATMILLFFSLIGSSLGVVSGESGQEITDMTAQMRAGGTFWPLFTLFILTLIGLFWFAVRLMAFASATVARGAVHVFRTWSWTKGHVAALAPAMVLLIVFPVITLSWIGYAISGAVIGAADTAFMSGLSTALITAVLLPGAWLGHGFAAAVYHHVAPADPD